MHGIDGTAARQEGDVVPQIIERVLDSAVQSEVTAAFDQFQNFLLQQLIRCIADDVPELSLEHSLADHDGGIMETPCFAHRDILMLNLMLADQEDVKDCQPIA